MDSVAEQLDALKSKSTKANSRRPAMDESDLSNKYDTRTDVILMAPTTEKLQEMGLPPTVHKKSNRFIIHRLFPALSKSGSHFITEGFEPEFITDWNPFAKDYKADWRYGSMLLLVDGLKDDLVQGVRNIKGEKKSMSGRLLRLLNRPWRLPTTLPFDKDGVPFKIVYPKHDINKEKGRGRKFEAGEPLWVLTEPGLDPDVMLPVIDFEGYRGEVYIRDVHYGVDNTPWGILVNRKWMSETIEAFNNESRRWAGCGLIERILKQDDSAIIEPTPIPASRVEDKLDNNSGANLTVPGKKLKLILKQDNSAVVQPTRTPGSSVEDQLDNNSGDDLTASGKKLKLILKVNGAKRNHEGNPQGEEKAEHDSGMANTMSGVRKFTKVVLRGTKIARVPSDSL